MTQLMSVPRPPVGSGAFLPPSRSDKGWRPTVEVDRVRIRLLIEQHSLGSVDGSLLWSVLLTHAISPVLSQWLKDIQPLVTDVQ